MVVPGPKLRKSACETQKLKECVEGAIIFILTGHERLHYFSPTGQVQWFPPTESRGVMQLGEEEEEEEEGGGG